MDYSIFDNLFDCIVVINAQSKAVYANQSFVRFCEVSHRRIVGEKSLHKVIHFEGIPLEAGSLKNIAAPTQYAECVVSLPQKGRRRVQFFAQPLAEGHWLIAFRDITLEDRLNFKYRAEIDAKESVIKKLDRNLHEKKTMLRLAERLSACKQGPDSLSVCLDEIEACMGFQESAIYMATSTGELENLCAKFLRRPNALVSGSTDMVKCRGWLADVTDPLKVVDDETLQTLKKWRLISQPTASALLWPLTIDGRGAWAVLSHHKDSAPRQLNSERLVAALMNNLTIAVDGCMLLDRSIRDGLTTLHNVSYFKSAIEREIHRSNRNQTSFSVILFDVDHFKKVNDKFGHQVGDRVLVQIAKLLLSFTRRSDLIARYGGEEFVLMLPDTNLVGAKALAEKARRNVGLTTIATAKGPLNVTVSAGCAEFPGMATDTASLIELADQGLYLAKSSGRNRVCAVEAVPAGSVPEKRQKLAG